MSKIKWYTTCPKCKATYHVSHGCCPNCELEQYWRDMAAYYQKEAERCLKTAETIAAEKAKGNDSPGS